MEESRLPKTVLNHKPREKREGDDQGDQIMELKSKKKMGF